MVEGKHLQGERERVGSVCVCVCCVCSCVRVRSNMLCVVLAFLLLHHLLQEYTSPAQAQAVSGRIQSQAGDSRSVIAIRNQVRFPPPTLRLTQSPSYPSPPALHSTCTLLL